jgi:1,4-alpha-glucan branching enzyme
MQRDPIHRAYHHNELTFRGIYAFNENFMLPLSHDEVVHGKGSLLGRMPGDAWQRAANLRLLLGYMWAQPGKKLLFMGGELGQEGEWSHEHQVEWHLLERTEHAGVQRWVRDLNRVYREMPSLHRVDFHPDGFEWIEANDASRSVLAFLRKAPGCPPVLAVFNLTPEPRSNYRMGVPRSGVWREILNSDASDYGGSGMGNYGEVEASPVPFHGRYHSLNLTLPPLSLLLFEGTGPQERPAAARRALRNGADEGPRAPGSARLNGQDAEPDGSQPSSGTPPDWREPDEP